MNDQRPVVIPGTILYLSHFVESDVSLLTQWYSQLETTSYVGMTGRSFTFSQERDWFQQYTSYRPDTQHFAIIAHDSQQPIGTVSLMDIRRPHNRAELGIAIGDQRYWGRGYGREAMRLMCDYGFTFLELHVIYLWYVSYNERGRRSYEAVGFRESGRIPEARILNGARYDDVLMSYKRADAPPSAFPGMFGQLPI